LIKQFWPDYGIKAIQLIIQINTTMFKKAIFLLALTACVAAANAQDYKLGIGVRGGLSNGLTVKYFMKPNTGLEFILANRWRGYNTTVLYEVHNPISGTPFRWYYGAGGHFGYWNGYPGHPWFKDDRGYSVIGLDGILGIEYNFKEIPFNISLDYKPTFNLTGYFGYWGDEYALSLRYLIRK
jgi:hypothetical protein